MTSLLIYFPISLVSFVCPYLYITFAILLCLVCAYLSITFIVRNTFSMHMAPTPRTHIEILGPTHMAIRSGGRFVVMLSL